MHCAEIDLLAGLERARALISEQSNFAFFDMHLTAGDSSLLNLTQRDGPVCMATSKAIDLDATRIQNFWHCSTNSKAQATEFVDLVKRIADAVLISSQAENAVLRLYSHLPEDVFGVGSGTHSWHVDKTHKEAFGIDDAAPSLTYIFPLVGNSTNYYSDQVGPRAAFNKRAVSTAVAYGCNDTCHYGDIFEQSGVVHAPTGYGSVHLNGISHGAMHSIPLTKPRITIIATPASQEAIKSIDSTAHTFSVPPPFLQRVQMQNAKQQLEALRMRGEQVSSSLGKDKSERNALGATETFSDCGPTSPSWHNVCKRENAEKAVRNSKRAALDLRIQSLTQEEGNIERAKAVLVQTQDVSTEETDVVGQADQREEALL